MKLLSNELCSSEYGGKAAGLSLLMRARNPLIRVPFGFALKWDEEYDPTVPLRAQRWAVRSSAIGEDGAENSFAGQHDTLLNIEPDNVASAVLRVRESTRNERVIAYRRRKGMTGEPKMGVVIQAMVSNVISSAVAFTKDPQEDDDSCVYIEHTSGLGDKLVGGKVNPLSASIHRNEAYLNTWLHRLARIALECEKIIGGHADVEAAYDGEDWWVCQARLITT